MACPRSHTGGGRARIQTLVCFFKTILFAPRRRGNSYLIPSWVHRACHRHPENTCSNNDSMPGWIEDGRAGERVSRLKRALIITTDTDPKVHRRWPPHELRQAGLPGLLPPPSFHQPEGHQFKIRQSPPFGSPHPSFAPESAVSGSGKAPFPEYSIREAPALAATLPPH